MVLASEFAGEAEAAGPGVTSFPAGDRVFGFSEAGSVRTLSICRFPQTVRSRPCRRA